MSISIDFIRQNNIQDFNKLPAPLHQEIQGRSWLYNKALFNNHQNYAT